MSHIHYFQRYSQKENVVTNNTLALFARLYQYNINLFEIFLNGLLTQEVKDISIGISIEQQKKIKKGSIPDGFLFQDSFKIVIETKLHQGFSIEQIEGHLQSFKDENRKILMSLSPEDLSGDLKQKMQEVIKRHNEIKGSSGSKIQMVATTFEKIIQTFKDTIDEGRDYEMASLLEDFADFCSSSGVLPTAKYQMRALTAGWSLPENFEYNLYYDHVSRGFSGHGYIGLYSNKSVCGVGKIENIVTADLVDGKLINIHSELNKPVTEDQKERIKASVPVAFERSGYEIATDHRFFLVDHFYETDFKKSSKYPIQRSRFFDLLKELGVNTLPDTAEIARLLSGKTWT